MSMVFSTFNCSPKYDAAHATGFTLIEILLATALLAVIVAIGTPSFSHLINNYKLRQAAESIADHLRYARSVAIKRNQPTYVSFSTDTQSNWCYSISTLSSCDCQNTNINNSCPTFQQGERYTQYVESNQFKGVSLRRVRFGNSSTTRFDPVRGTAKFGSLELTAVNKSAVEIRLSILGRVRVCINSTQSSSFSNYPIC